MKKLKAISREVGYPVTEIIRRVPGNWLEKQDKKKGLSLEGVWTVGDAKDLLREIGGVKKKRDTKS